MGRFLKFGCLGIVGLVVLMVVIAGLAGTKKDPPQQIVASGGQAPPAAVSTAVPMGTVGDTVKAGNWELTLRQFDTYEKVAGKPLSAGTPKPQGTLLVADFSARNLHSATSNFTSNDFLLIAPDGRQFKTASVAIEKNFPFTQQVQPGLVTENRVVFDADPAVKEWTLKALGMQFAVVAP